MAGQDWLSPLPRAGGQGWGCPGCSRSLGAAVAPTKPGVVSGAGCSHPTAQPLVEAGLCWRWGCLLFPSPADGAGL